MALVREAAGEGRRAVEVAGVAGLVPPRQRARVTALRGQHVLEDPEEVAVPAEELADIVDDGVHLLVHDCQVVPARPGAGVVARRGLLRETLDGLDVLKLVLVGQVAPLVAHGGVGAAGGSGGSGKFSALDGLCARLARLAGLAGLTGLGGVFNVEAQELVLELFRDVLERGRDFRRNADAGQDADRSGRRAGLLVQALQRPRGREELPRARDEDRDIARAVRDVCRQRCRGHRGEQLRGVEFGLQVLWQLKVSRQTQRSSRGCSAQHSSNDSTHDDVSRYRLFGTAVGEAATGMCL